MKRLYLMNTQVKELKDCIMSRICILSADLKRLKNIEDQDKLCDRINVLSDIYDILTDGD